MSDEKLERVSALADGALAETPAQHALEEVIEDPALRRRWHRYHLIGEAMRGNLAGRHGAELAARVGAALDTEPVLLAPRRRLSGAVRPLVGIAIAASVAVVAVLGVRTLAPFGTPAAQAVAVAPPADASAAAGPMRGDESVLVVRTGASGGAARVSWNDLGPNLSTRLNGYLVNHAEHRSSSMPGMLPYARIVGHERRD